MYMIVRKAVWPCWFRLWKVGDLSLVSGNVNFQMHCFYSISISCNLSTLHPGLLSSFWGAYLTWHVTFWKQIVLLNFRPNLFISSRKSQHILKTDNWFPSFEGISKFVRICRKISGNWEKSQILTIVVPAKRQIRKSPIKIAARHDSLRKALRPPSTWSCLEHQVSPQVSIFHNPG